MDPASWEPDLRACSPGPRVLGAGSQSLQPWTPHPGSRISEPAALETASPELPDLRAGSPGPRVLGAGSQSLQPWTPRPQNRRISEPAALEAVEEDTAAAALGRDAGVVHLSLHLAQRAQEAKGHHAVVVAHRALQREGGFMSLLSGGRGAGAGPGCTYKVVHLGKQVQGRRSLAPGDPA